MILPLPYTLEGVVIQTWVFVAALLGSIIIHEAAHLIALRNYGKNPTVWYKHGDGFNVGYPKDYMGLTKTEKKNVYAAGIVSGLVFILPPFFWLYPSFAFGLAAVYFVGCRHDFKEIVRLK